MKKTKEDSTLFMRIASLMCVLSLVMTFARLLGAITWGWVWVLLPLVLLIVVLSGVAIYLAVSGKEYGDKSNYDRS